MNRATICLHGCVACQLGVLNGFRASLTNLFFIILFAAAYTAMARKVWPALSVARRVVLGCVPIVLFPLVITGPYGALAYLSCSLAVLAVQRDGRTGHTELRLHVTCWCIAIALTVLAMLAVAEFPAAWILLNSAFRGLSRFLNRIYIGQSLEMGPSYWYWELLLLFAVLTIARRIVFAQENETFAWTTELKTAFLVLCPILFTPLLYLAGAALLARFPPNVVQRQLVFEFGRGEFHNLASYLFPRYVGVAVLCLMIALDLVFLRRRGEASDNSPSSAVPTIRWRWHTLGVILSYWLIAAFLHQPPATSKTDPRRTVVIHDPGGGLSARPSDGQDYLGLFAKLPIFLEGLGYHVVARELDASRFDECDVLVLINLPQKFPSDLKHRIQKYVHGGGSLLCLGDHTGREAIREPFNDLVADLGIEFNFDSACPLYEWSPGLMQFDDSLFVDPLPGPLVDQTHSIGVGASLTIRAPARPAIVGRYGFSDPGDEKNSRGYLGNLKYDFGESLGDQVLVAQARYGQGRVLVFGDTSPFQNTAISRSHNFVARVFDSLTTARPPRRWMPFGLLLAAAAATTLLNGRQPILAASVFLVLVCLYHQTRIRGEASDSRGLQFAENGRNATVLVDAYHHSTYDPFGGTPKGIAGVDTAFLRRRHHVLHWMRPIANLPRVKYFVLLSPSAAISRSEVDELERFMRDGGIVLLASGFDNQAALRHLLNRFGMTISYTPFGGFQAQSQLPGKEDISFRSGWPITAEGEHESLCRVWARDIIVRKRIGKGSLVVVGDAEFFVEANLEGMRTAPQPQNIRFVQSLLNYLESS